VVTDGLGRQCEDRYRNHGFFEQRGSLQRYELEVQIGLSVSTGSGYCSPYVVVRPVVCLATYRDLHILHFQCRVRVYSVIIKVSVVTLTHCPI
jgi:hypothetical protein